MENMEINEVITNTNDAVEEIVDAVPTGKSGLKTAAAVGFIGAASITAWELAIKPLGRKVKNLVTKKLAVKKPKKAESDDDDLYDAILEDIPEIDE